MIMHGLAYISSILDGYHPMTGLCFYF